MCYADRGKGHWFIVFTLVFDLYYCYFSWAGGGYVLSREALRIFVEQALTNDKKCKRDNTGAEDAEMGK